MQKKILYLLLTMIIAFSLFACSEKKDYRAINLTQTKNTEFSSFSAPDINGTAVDQSIFKDYPLTVINIWGTYCPPCLAEMPYLGELAKEYQNRGLNIIGIISDIQENDSYEEQIQEAKDIIAKTGANYTHLLPSQDLYQIILSEISSIPFTLFVDSDGNVLATRSGAMTKAKWKEVFDYMLKYVD